MLPAGLIRAIWLESQTVGSSSGLISQERPYSAYAMACVASGQPVITRQMFGRKLKQWRPELQEAQRVVDGKKQWVYLGIALDGSGARESLGLMIIVHLPTTSTAGSGN